MLPSFRFQLFSFADILADFQPRQGGTELQSEHAQVKVPAENGGEGQIQT